MVGSASGFDCYRGIGQALNYISDFQVILTISVLRKPPGSDAMNPIAAHKWIIQTFCDLVAEGRHILESRTEEAGAYPAGIVEDVAFFAKAIAGIPRLKIISMEAEHATFVWVAIEVKVGVGEKKSSDAFGGDVASLLGSPNGSGRIV